MYWQSDQTVAFLCRDTARWMRQRDFAWRSALMVSSRCAVFAVAQAHTVWPEEIETTGRRLSSPFCFVAFLTELEDEGDVAPLARQTSPVLTRPTW